MKNLDPLFIADVAGDFAADAATSLYCNADSSPTVLCGRVELYWPTGRLLIVGAI